MSEGIGLNPFHFFQHFTYNSFVFTNFINFPGHNPQITFFWLELQPNHSKHFFSRAGKIFHWFFLLFIGNTFQFSVV